jgi:hypothetical protein
LAVGNILNDGKLFCSNWWQNVRARWCHTSKHCAPSNILWAAFTAATPLQVILYHQKLWFVRWIRLYRRSWSWSVNITYCSFYINKGVWQTWFHCSESTECEWDVLKARFKYTERKTKRLQRSKWLCRVNFLSFWPSTYAAWSSVQVWNKYNRIWMRSLLHKIVLFYNNKGR